MYESHNTNARYIDATAANLIVAHEKVLQIAEGHIPLPEVVELFLTNYCSFACPHCRCIRYHGDNSQFMDFNSLISLLDELAEKSIKTIELGGGGEPLEHPMITEILQLFVKRQFRIGIITNGYVLTKQSGLIDSIIECADWIRFSLDGITDDVFQKVHGKRNLSYCELREQIVNMVHRVKSTGLVNQRPKIGIKLIAQRPNQHQLVDAIEEALDMGVNYLQFKWLEQHPWSIPFEERPAIAGAIQTKLGEITGQDLNVDVLPGYGGQQSHERCLMNVLHPLIDWDGTIYMCAFFHHRKETHSIGSIANSKFFDCWGSPLHKQRLDSVNPLQCVANCPLHRYDPVIKYILSEDFRFKYI